MSDKSSKYASSIQSSIQFTKVLWSSNKTAEVEHSFIMALCVNIERATIFLFLPTYNFLGFLSLLFSKMCEEKND